VFGWCQWEVGPFNLKVPMISTQPPNLPHRTGFITSFLSGSFSYCRLDILTRSSAAARDGNEIPWPPSSTCTRCREIGNLHRRRVIVRAPAFILSASVLSEFLLLLDLLPFLPSCPSVLQQNLQQFPRILPIVYPFSISFLYTDTFLPVPLCNVVHEHRASGAYKTPQS